jgi:hypothetical protein
VLQRSKYGAILKGMMRRTLDAVMIAPADANQAYRKIVQADVVADLFEGACIAKRAYAVYPRAHAATGKAGGNRYHVLLGYAHVNKSIA